MLNTKKILKIANLDFSTNFFDDYLHNTEFKDFNELMDYLNGDDCNDMHSLIHECADSMVDVYCYDLRKWSVDNYDKIEEAIDELGAPEPFDFHKAIQYGQYHHYNQQIWEDVETLKEYLTEKYKF